MINCGTLQIGSTVPQKISNYRFGVSKTPTISLFQDSNIFIGLDTGTYYWSVQKKSDGTIVKVGSSQVVCSTSSDCCSEYRKNVINIDTITIPKSEHKLEKIKAISVFLNGESLILQPATTVTASKDVILEFAGMKFTGEIVIF